MTFGPLHSGSVSFAGGDFTDTVFAGQAYVSTALLDSLFGGSELWHPALQQLELRDAHGRVWLITLGNPFISIAGKLFNLTDPVQRGPETIYLPLAPLQRLLRVRFGIDWKAADETSAASREPTGDIIGIEIGKRNGGAWVWVQTTSPLRWEGISTDSQYLLKLRGAALAPDCPRQVAGSGFVTSVTALQEMDAVQFSLGTDSAVDSVETVREPNRWGFHLIAAMPPAPETAAAAVRLPDRHSRETPTVILDPGHGGKDRGASYHGVEEAVITLAVAKDLQKDLQDQGYRVLLTRDDDTYKTLAERPKFASDHHGDLFLSLHCNSLPGPPSRFQSVSGSTVYILRAGASDEDKALARRENQAVEEESGKADKTDISPVDWILLEHQLNLYSKQSEALAESIVHSFQGFEIPKYSTGARQAGFFVLVGAYMPAALFEMGFLTNNHDRRILNSASGQHAIARRLAAAIERFLPDQAEK